ncbi:MAG: alkanesulfonate monooxygenase SsuD [Gammaproteobacteria bacterium]|jgi:alkanesulfonate monooxygenase SsuD/methylene tetrahydromethanopterin reductase-like flavin-dependent oxidoreductase (luciferase family)
MHVEFGYFTLSDNAYPGNTRSANTFIREIREQAILADTLGYHSAWIGEHHFDSLGVNSRPDLVLASIIPETRNIRLAPAVQVLPLHHPIHVAETWATLDLLSDGRVDFACGRGYDPREYAPFGAPYMRSAEIFEEAIDVLTKAWSSDGPWSHEGEFFNIPQMTLTPTPVQRPLPFYVGCFSETSLEMAAKRGLNIIFAPFAAAMMFGGLDRAVAMYRERCEHYGHLPGRAMCSYFIYIADTPEEDDYGRQAQIDYFRHCVMPAFPSDPAKAPPTAKYFAKIVENLDKMRKEDLTMNSLLIGPSERISEQLQRVSDAGIEEVILYFNVGNKPHTMVTEQMHRFMEEIAPDFRGAIQ